MDGPFYEPHANPNSAGESWACYYPTSLLLYYMYNKRLTSETSVKVLPVLDSLSKMSTRGKLCVRYSFRLPQSPLPLKRPLFLLGGDTSASCVIHNLCRVDPLLRGDRQVKSLGVGHNHWTSHENANKGQRCSVEILYRKAIPGYHLRATSISMIRLLETAPHACQHQAMGFAPTRVVCGCGRGGLHVTAAVTITTGYFLSKDRNDVYYLPDLKEGQCVNFPDW